MLAETARGYFPRAVSAVQGSLTRQTSSVDSFAPAIKALPAKRAGKSGARRRRSPGWVPNQHGAWAMLIAPVLVGSWPSFTWRQILLLVVAVVAYLALYAVGLWLKSGRKARYRSAALTYAAITTVLLAALVISEPRLLAWAPVYAGGIGLSLWASWRRDDRSWWNDIVLVFLACGATLVAAGMRPVADGVAVLSIAPAPFAWPPPGLRDGFALMAAAVLLAYFLGTVVHVKGMIRDRNNPAVYLGSVIYHVVAVMLAVVAIGMVPGGVLRPFGVAGAVAAWASWLLVVTSVALLVRAIVVPTRWPGLSPKGICLIEMGATVLAMITAVVAGLSVSY